MLGSDGLGYIRFGLVLSSDAKSSRVVYLYRKGIYGPIFFFFFF